MGREPRSSPPGRLLITHAQMVIKPKSMGRRPAIVIGEHSNDGELQKFIAMGVRPISTFLEIWNGAVCF